MDNVVTPETPDPLKTEKDGIRSFLTKKKYERLLAIAQKDKSADIAKALLETAIEKMAQKLVNDSGYRDSFYKSTPNDIEAAVLQMIDTDSPAPHIGKKRPLWSDEQRNEKREELNEKRRQYRRGLGITTDWKNSR